MPVGVGGRTFTRRDLLRTLFGSGASAQPARFEGRLVNEPEGKPVAGASISIVSATGSVRTDDILLVAGVEAPTFADHAEHQIVFSAGQL